MGFKATEAVSDLTYDFTPHGPEGVIPEPTSAQVEAFQKAQFDAFVNLGIDPDKIRSGDFKLEEADALFAKSKDLLEAMTNAAADLSGIAQSTLRALPYRVKVAFIGWLTSEFANPQR